MKTIKIMKIFAGTAFLLAAALSLSGCNFFSWATPQVPGMSSEDFTARGEEYFRANNYSESQANFSNALVINPNNTRARLGFARAKLWLCFPDLVLLITKKMETTPNGIEAVVLSLNSQEGKDVLTRIHNTSDLQSIVSTLDSPYGIINDNGDDVISSESMEANQYLLLCYMALFFINFLDSNKDGVFGVAPDYCILSNGNLVFRFELSGMLSNIMVSTNITNGVSRTDALILMQGAHDACEDVVNFCSFIYLSLDYSISALNAILRPSIFLKQMNTNNIYPKGGQFTSYYEEFRDAATNTNANSVISPVVKQLYWFRKFPEFVGVEMNAMHQVMVGAPVYTGNIGTFRRSAWADHTGGLKTVLELCGPVIDNATAITLFGEITNSITTIELDDMLHL